MKQTGFSISIACGLLTLLLWGCLGLAQKNLTEIAARQPQTLAAPHGPAPQATTTGALALTAKLNSAPTSCGNRSAIAVITGTVVYYCYEVRNNTTQTLQITLDAPAAGTRFRDNPFDVKAGETVKVPLANTRVISRAVTSSLVEVAIATAIKDNSVVSATATSEIFVTQPPNLALTLGRTSACATTTSLSAQLNGRLYYCIKIDNTTAYTLNNHIIHIPASGFQTSFVYILPPKSSIELTNDFLSQLGIVSPISLTQRITRAQESTVTVTSYINGETPIAASRKVRWDIGQTGIDVQKTISLRDSTACPPNTNVVTVARDTPIYYCLRVKNTGLITLTNHSFFEPNTALGGAVVNGQFTYVLGPGKTMTLTQANLASTNGLIYTTQPVLGPFQQPVTATNILTFTASNADNFRASDTATGTIRIGTPAIDYALTVYNNQNTCLALGSPPNVNIGDRIYYCMVIKNTSQVTLTRHAFNFRISPPKKQGDRYGYVANGTFNYALGPNQSMFITNTFLARVGLPPLMGPYTVTVPLTNSKAVTNASVFTASNPVEGHLAVKSALVTAPYASFSTATPTPPLTPENTATFTPFPGQTPTPSPTVPPTPVPPTPTTIFVSPLPQPAPTPDLRVREVSAPVATQPGQLPQGQSPLPTPPGFDSPLPTPTFPLDPALVAATQTVDAALTATAFATLQPPTPTFTETPSPTPLPTDTATPTETPTATPTQRPIVAPTATTAANSGALLPSALQSMIAVAGWIWLLIGVLAFFIAAGVVAGMGLRQRQQQHYQLDEPLKRQASQIGSGQRSPKPTQDDDNWPTSLP